MIVPAVNVLWDFTSQFQYSALMPLMLWGFVKWSDVGSNSRVFLLCLFASLALGSIEIQDDPQFQQDMVAFLVSMVLFCFVSRVVFAFGWRASSGTTGSLRTEASNHVRFRWLVIMNPIVCGEWQEITYSSGATICSPWMSLTGSSNSEAFTDHPARCAKLEGPKELLDAISLCYCWCGGLELLKAIPTLFLKNGIWGGESYWNFILKFHFCNHVAFAFQEEEVSTALDWMGSFLLPQAFNWQHLVESRRAGKQFEGLSALLACSQRKLHHTASPCELKTDPRSDEIEKTKVAVGLALKQSGLLDTDGPILLT